MNPTKLGVVAGLLCGANIAIAAPLLAKNGIEPIALNNAADLFRQCSRDAPKPQGPLWVPSSGSIRKLESMLPDYIATLEKAGELTPSKNESFFRQYIGFDRDGKKFIYGSFYTKFASSKSGKANLVCDGWTNSWGIVFSVQEERFSEFLVNGHV